MSERVDAIFTTNPDDVPLRKHLPTRNAQTGELTYPDDWALTFRQEYLRGSKVVRLMYGYGVIEGQSLEFGENPTTLYTGSLYVTAGPDQPVMKNYTWELKEAGLFAGKLKKGA